MDESYIPETASWTLFKMNYGVKKDQRPHPRASANPLSILTFRYCNTFIAYFISFISALDHIRDIGQVKIHSKEENISSTNNNNSYNNDHNNNNDN